MRSAASPARRSRRDRSAISNGSGCPRRSSSRAALISGFRIGHSTDALRAQKLKSATGRSDAGGRVRETRRIAEERARHGKHGYVFRPGLPPRVTTMLARHRPRRPRRSVRSPEARVRLDRAGHRRAPAGAGRRCGSAPVAHFDRLLPATSTFTVAPTPRRASISVSERRRAARPSPPRHPAHRAAVVKAAAAAAVPAQISTPR